MASQNQICKNITTLGEKLQNIATSLIQQRQPQRLRSQFLKTDLETITRLSEKEQDIDSSHIQQKPPKSRLLQFAENIHNKYLYQPANFNAEQSGILQNIQAKYSLIKPKMNAAIPTLEKATPQSLNFLQQKKLDSSESPENSQARTHSEQSQLEEKVERSSYSPINTSLKNFLDSILNIRIPNVKVYANPAADNLAKCFSADAITYDDKILFRTGKYNPQNPESIALLGHELTHIVYSQNPNNRQITRDNVEEQSALNNEKQVLSYFSFPEVQKNYQQPSIPQARDSYTPISASHQTRVNAPKAAGESRDVSLPTPTNSTFELTEKHLKKIWEYVEPKINNKIITTGERGG